MNIDFVKIKKYFIENLVEIRSILLITFIAFALRMIAVNNYGDFNLDELYSIYFANQNSLFQTIKLSITQDIHLPFYYIILHFWVKIFGCSSKSAHILSLVLSLPLIPIAYYSIKNLFNRTAGYFASIFLALNTFCIYYSVEASFYCLSLSLSLLLSFLFVKMVEKFEKKYVILFVIVHTLLIYTNTIASILAVFFALVGFSYVLIKKRNIKEFFLTYILIFLLSVPAIIFETQNHIILSNNIVNYAKQAFSFNIYIIYDILENFFSNENYQLMLHSNNEYRDFFDNIFNLKYFVLCAIPVFLSIFGFFKGLLSKNLRLMLFALPSLFALIYIILLSSADAIFFQTKYLLVLYPVIISTLAFGLSLIRNKVLSVSLFSFLIYLNLMHLFLVQNNILNYKNLSFSNLNTAINNYAQIKDKDKILIPFASQKIKTQISKGDLIPFSFDEALYLKDKNSLKFYFGEKLTKKINKNNVKEELKEFIAENKIPQSYNDNLSEIFKNMEKGEKFIIISPFDKITGVVDISPIQESQLENYKNLSLFPLLMMKNLKDSLVLADKNLKFIRQFTDDKRFYTIYVYEK